MKHIFSTFFLFSVILSGLLSSCEKYDDQPAVNAGYDTKWQVPTPGNMNAADSAYVDSLKKEYQANAK